MRRPRRDGGCRNRRNHHGRGKDITGEGSGHRRGGRRHAERVGRGGRGPDARAFRPNRYPAQQCRGHADGRSRRVERRQFSSSSRSEHRLGLPDGKTAILPHMLRHGNGGIVNISSLAAIRWTGYPYFAYYAAEAAVNQRRSRWPCNTPAEAFGPIASCRGYPAHYTQISSEYASVEEMIAARMPLCRSGAWEPLGTSRTPPFFSPPRKRGSSRAFASRSTAARVVQ